ncbi:UPF0715 family protein [Tuberibacillus sp. Marseille-P3662]|uniref:UPF0715 family protein n=1 Tax=Tuberibacillus sp. Marseille-P3662 TaxID=1965358 RepID=UPI000A1C9184
MLKIRLKLIFFAGFTMSIIYLLVENQSFDFSFSVIYIFLFYGIVYTLFYGVFALPIQVLLNKYSDRRKINIKYLVVYLLASFIIHLIIYRFFNSYEPFFSNSQVYLHIFVTSITFWIWDSIVMYKHRDELI